jgi:NADH-ubiquinone oxidoreductase chain 4
MVPVHLWLPEAHVEAPRRFSYISRSSVEIRDLWVYLLVTFVSKSVFFFAPLVYTIAAVGIIYTSQLFVRLISKEL